MELTTLLFIIVIALVLLCWILYKIGLRQGRYQKEIEWQEQISSLRADTANHQRANIKGKVAESFAPFLPNFPFKPSECKFIGDPIDYLVFEGLDNRDIKAIHLVEVKSDTSKLSKHQKQIKDLIDSLYSDKVTFKEFDFKSEI